MMKLASGISAFMSEKILIDCSKPLCLWRRPQKIKFLVGNLDYFNSKNLLTIYGNVVTESVQGTTKSDKLVVDLKDQTLNMTMYNNEQVNVKLKKK